jgi:hypothetical protein
VQQRAQYPAHMGVVVDDEETQPVEIDADHGAPGLGRYSPTPCSKASEASLTNGLGRPSGRAILINGLEK